MEERRRLATPEITRWVKKIKKEMTRSPPLGGFQEPPADFRHGYVLRLRLSRHEREMLEVAAADEDHRCSPLPALGQPGLAKQVAVLLFLRWSFAHHTLREMLHQLGEAETDSDSESTEFGETSWGWYAVDRKSEKEKRYQSALLMSFAVGLATRLDNALPFDARRERVKELLSDPENEEFWDNYQNCHASMASELDNDYPEKFAVAPVPEDENIWLKLANKVIKMHHVMRKWPGVHEAAGFAAQSLGIHNIGPGYPFDGIWFRGFLAATSQATAHRGRPNAHSHWVRLQNGTTRPDIRAFLDFDRFRYSVTYPQYEEEWVETIYAWVDGADVWDVWTFLRMIHCASTSRDITPREHSLLRVALYQAGPPNLLKECSPSILHPKDFVDVARYNSPDYQLRPITSQNTIAELLEKAGLEATGNWDLVSLKAMKETTSLPDQLWSLGGHYRHVFYLTEDVTSRYLGNNRDLLCLNIPSKCDPWECPGHCNTHDGVDGRVVFARRRLDPALLSKILERYWIDWNDCMLIFGRGNDGRGNLIDGSSIYLLETLPGIKLRDLKRKTSAEARGLASACLYLNLKLEHQYEGNLGRDTLKSIMRERYQPRFSDFTCLLQRREAGIDWTDAVTFGHGRYGTTHEVPWKVGRRYDQLGNVSCNRYETGMVLIRIIAQSENESRAARYDMFCSRLESFYEYVAGNRFKNVVHFYGFMSIPVKSYKDDNGNDQRPIHYRPNSSVHRDRAWAFVFEHTEGSLLQLVGDMVDDSYERETWLAIFTFLHDIGSTLRDMHATIGPYRSLNPDKVLVRLKRPTVRAADFNIPHLHDRYAAPMGTPPANRFEALRLGNTTLHTPATDAYSFAHFALHLIDVASNGLYTGLCERVNDQRVVYVELLKGLEDILAAEFDLLEKAGGGSGGDEGDEPRTRVMDRFLRLAKQVVDGSVVLDGHYPVQEASAWYRFSTAFPRVWNVIGTRRHREVDWFRREKVLLYYIYRPKDWGWNTDEPSSGSENDDDEEDIWDGSDEDDSVKSDFTDIYWWKKKDDEKTKQDEPKPKPTPTPSQPARRIPAMTTTNQPDNRPPQHQREHHPQNNHPPHTPQRRRTPNTRPLSDPGPGLAHTHYHHRHRHQRPRSAPPASPSLDDAHRRHRHRHPQPTFSHSTEADTRRRHYQHHRRHYSHYQQTRQIYYDARRESGGVGGGAAETGGNPDEERFLVEGVAARDFAVRGFAVVWGGGEEEEGREEEEVRGEYGDGCGDGEKGEGGGVSVGGDGDASVDEGASGGPSSGEGGDVPTFEERAKEGVEGEEETGGDPGQERFLAEGVVMRDFAVRGGEGKVRRADGDGYGDGGGSVSAGVECQEGDDRDEILSFEQ
ncbi:uncharacterized protein B0H64DRAFT_462973 [Chaetomium fimeti]|uniref:Protein kinase domain-containing protein n=1 Tax=Chaetomium fimeti TaxID=1854472 RepID=A0AAE0HD61_9PEZI|nr:hypothetical protein B0H64DRAFT_462973 [Chaetomium fimeti]